MTHRNKNLVIAAYDYLFENDRLKELYNILDQIQKSHIYINNKDNSFFFTNTTKNIDYVYNQYLFNNIATRDLNEQLLLSLVFSKKITHPLPPHWIKILKNNNLAVNSIISRFNFLIFLLKKYLVNFYLSLKSLKNNVYKNPCNLFPENYIQFCDITKQSLPLHINNQKNWNIIDWAINWHKSEKKFNKIFHNVCTKRILYLNYEIDSAKYFIKSKSKIKILFWVVISTILSFYYLLKGKFSYAILLYEAFENKIYNEIPKNNLANEYLFSISSLYRPLWTYTVENFGSKITLFGYASSFGGFKSKNTNEILESEYDNTTWPNILFWTNNYVEFIKSKVSENINVEKVDYPIYLSDNDIALPTLPKKFITIFDITPVDDFNISRSLCNLKYRNPETAISFLLDIYKIAEEFNYKIIWKQKRKYSSIHSIEYIKFCEKFQEQKNIINIDPETSAFRLIQKSNIVISVPFTSTAFIADFFNKRSLFYDPKKLIYKDDRGLQDIPLLSGFEELLNYFKNLENE
jgi:polysaccharide biosynthesis PFTS motif protein